MSESYTSRDEGDLTPGATVVVAPYEGRLPVSGTVTEVDDLRVRVQRSDGWANWYDVSEVQVISL